MFIHDSRNNLDKQLGFDALSSPMHVACIGSRHTYFHRWKA